MLRFDTPTAHLRAAAFIEGLSYLALLCIAMPLKYLADMPIAVTIVGSIHGGLFMWLMILVALGWLRRGRNFGWAFRIGVASVIPGGTFAIDGQLKREDEEHRRQRS